jgi:AraC-like DNA-binding protein
MVCVPDETRGTARSTRAQAGGGVWFSLTHYSGSGHQPAHSHDFHQISFLVSGSLRERLQREEYELHCAAIGFKPAGAPHEDRWGQSGALLFSINLPADWPFSRRPRPQWRRLQPGFPLAATIASSFAAPGPADPSEAVEATLRLLAGEPPHIPPPPRWIESVRTTLALQPELTIGEAAARVEVDRAHLARTFRRVYGVAPSVHRRRALACRAVDAIARSRGGLSEIAYELGFADQAHMSRVLRIEAGLSPQRLRRLLTRKITSIQDAAPFLV